MEILKTDVAKRKLTRLDRQRRPVVLRLVVFMVCFCLLIVGLQSWNLWQSRQAELDETAVSTTNMARALAAQAESAFKVGDAVLDEIVERVEHDGSTGAAGERIHYRMADIVRTTPGVHGVLVFGSKGDWRITWMPPTDESRATNNTDREYFRWHAAHTERATRIGKPIISRSLGKWVIPLTRRIDNPDGSFGGVALVIQDLDFFGKFYDSFDVGQSGTILLAGDDGTLYYRRPFNPGLIGTDVSNGPVLTMARESGRFGTRMMRANLDGVTRLYSYRHLEGFPLVVASAMARDEILADWRRQAVITSTLGMLAVLLLAWAGFRMVRQIRVRDQLERQLRAAGESLQRHNTSLQSLADSDGLTGLANRRLFEASLTREYERARRSGTAFSVILADVDHFKKFNDRYGHVAGDDCLRRVAAAVGSGPRRPPDLAARYGGEEFAIILPDTDLAGAIAVAEKIRQGVAGLDIEHADSTFGHVSASLGVFSGRPIGAAHNDPMAWIEAADQQLYEAKAAGRNRIAAHVGD
ncbi:GGDEF domain-containing protein [Massilia sp. 9096]|uniref:sensor domain-containing diguanylate cyclase n=1 Tax=Massilia sp. 9096 TaxID=1500894 RepID=UPI00068C28AC|nr:GGDEF domain-containing protein [Massilia sp. 9096]